RAEQAFFLEVLRVQLLLTHSLQGLRPFLSEKLLKRPFPPVVINADFLVGVFRQPGAKSAGAALQEPTRARAVLFSKSDEVVFPERPEGVLSGTRLGAAGQPPA